MIALKIITLFLTSLILLLIEMKYHIQYFIENLRFSKKLMFLLTVTSVLAVLLIGSLIEKKLYSTKFFSLSNVFLFYLFIRVYNNSEKKVTRYL